MPTCVCPGLLLRPHQPLTPADWARLQGVILCFGLCARGQAKTVLNVLHDFEERIQESEQSWQIGAWRVRLPRGSGGLLEQQVLPRWQ